MTTYTWTATTGGAFGDAADWTPNGVPNAGEDAVFATGGNAYTVSGGGAAASISADADAVTFTGASLQVGTSGLTGTDNAYVDIASGALVDDSGGVDFASGTLLEVDGRLNSAGGTADVALVTGSGAKWTASSSLTFNQLYVTQHGDFTDAGSVTLNDGGALNLDTSATFTGTLSLAGDATVYVAQAATLSSGPYALAASIDVTAGHILTLGDDPGVTADVSGGIAGAGSVTVSDGDVTFAAPNAYTGGTNVQDATLTLTGAGAAGTGPIFLDSGTLTLQADSSGSAGAETIVGAGGDNTVDDTVSALSGSLLVFASDSNTFTFTGGDNNATVVGGSGVLDATGGFGFDAIYGGSSGHDVLVTGTGPTTLASAFGGTLTALGGAPNTLVAAGGNTTLAGASSYGRDLYFASGTGTTVVEAGSGNSTVVASGADNEIFGATGTQAVFLSGSGVTQLDFVSGFEGGTNDIIGFGASDSLHLTGYSASAAQDALASATVTGGNTILALSDNTQIVLFGYTGVTAATFT